MQVFLTGATGFVGAHLLRVLVERGDRVRCLVRRSSAKANATENGRSRPRSRANIEEFLDHGEVEVVEGDLTDLEALRGGIAGCRVVYHCAADYRLHVPEPAGMYASNVDGTSNVMEAASELGVERVVYTSTVGALGLRADGRPADETMPVGIERMTGHYKRSKYKAERVAEEWAARGLPVVIVNPSAPVGEMDVKPTATGQLVLDFLNGRMGAYVETGLNLIDVRDCAVGHVLAAERGRDGEKYILGHRNMTLKQILDTLADITGGRSPRLKLPHWVPMTVAAVDTFAAGLTGRSPRFPLDGVRMSRNKMFFDPQKAVRELGLPQTPVEEALRRAVTWFREHGYTRDHAGRPDQRGPRTDRKMSGAA